MSGVAGPEENLVVLVEIPRGQLEELVRKTVLQELAPEVGRYDPRGNRLRGEIIDAVKRSVDSAARSRLVAEIVQSEIDAKLRAVVVEAVGEELVRLARRAAKKHVELRAGQAADFAQAQLSIPGGAR